jgi:hypothetical protein
MKIRTSLALVVVAVLALAAGWYFGVRLAPSSQSSVAAGTLVFPDLAPKLQAATRVEVQHQATTLVVAKDGDRWVLPDKGNYPIQQDKLAALLTGLTELRITEPRTSDPAQYSRLGVEDPKGPAATSNLLRVLDAAGKPIAELIVGHRRVRTQGNVPETVYIRRPGEAQSWLAEGSLSVDADPQLWIDRDIMSIDRAKVASVTVSRGDETLEIKPDGDKAVLAAPADHPKLDDYKLDDVLRGLDSLTLTDVKPAAQEPGAKIGSSVYTTTDGEKITATVFKMGDGDKAEIWAQFAATGDGASKADAAKLQARVAGWAYQLGNWKEAALVPTLDQLKAAEPAPAAAGNAPAGGTPGMPPGMSMPGMTMPGPPGADSAPAAPK